MERLLTIIGTLCAVLLTIAAGVALAHKEEGELYAYPAHCCGGNDCAPIINVVRLGDGSMRITTKHGTAVFPSDFKWEEFDSQKAHACFSPEKLYCLLGRTGI